MTARSTFRLGIAFASILMMVAVVVVIVLLVKVLFF